jgi:hypothetical protein
LPCYGNHYVCHYNYRHERHDNGECHGYRDYPPPTVSISADSETIQAGDSATLTWSSTDADSAIIDQGVGTVATNGSVTVSPNETTTYTISVVGPGGTATADVTVNIGPIGISITLNRQYPEFRKEYSKKYYAQEYKRINY